jgi:cytoskeletal protein CcmA (bactofilin family)
MVTRIEPTTLLKGNIEAKEDIVVEGKVEGSINTTEKVTVAKGAIVKGPISSREIEIGGIVEGNVCSKECTKLLAFGKVQGDLKTGHLYVEDGGILAGKVTTDERSQLISEPDCAKKK